MRQQEKMRLSQCLNRLHFTMVDYCSRTQFLVDGGPKQNGVGIERDSEADLDKEDQFRLP